MLITLLLASAQPEAPAPASGPETAPDCSYDLEAMLELTRDEFDQDMNGGWRPLGQIDGCEIAAAELIRAWRHEKRDHTSILYWHEGQMRAFGGQTAEAVALFQLTYSPPEFDTGFGWNYYVSGSVAFLLRDREHLQQMIAELRAVPEPDNNSFTRADGTVVELSWPPNLDVLEAFDRCWNQSYAEAYALAECRAPQG